MPPRGVARKETPARIALVDPSDVERVLQLAKDTSNKVSIAWRPIRCTGFDDVDGKRIYHHFTGKPCSCEPSCHLKALLTDAFEIACGGGRGSAKSQNTYGFILKGNTSFKSGHECDKGYYLHPKYKFLVVRKNVKDLKEWFRDFKQIVQPMGAECVEGNGGSAMEVRFPSGAWGAFGHLDDEDSYTQYQGRGLTRVVVEEAGHIPTEERYLRAIYFSVRASEDTPELRPQIMLTFNPGGPGHSWLRQRFLYPGARSTQWKPGRVYMDPEKKTRIFFHSTVADNPYFMSGNQEYVRSLESMKHTNPTLYAQWALGDFDAVEGAYFGEFRQKPGPGEPENACHVLKCQRYPNGEVAGPPVKLESWYSRAISCDWGFHDRSAVYWSCWTPDQRMHIYRELSVSKVGTLALGARIAEMSLPDLQEMETPQMSLHLSHDCFSRTDDCLSAAEQIAQGIDEVLGPGSAFVFAPSIEDEHLSYKEAMDLVEERFRSAGPRASILVTRAVRDRKPGWDLIRDYLRWWPLVDEKFDEERGRELRKRHGELQYAQYVERCNRAAEKKLPVLQIWDCCPELIKGMIGAQCASNDVNDVAQKEDHEIDSLRYNVMGHRFAAGPVPRSVWIAQRVQRAIKDIPDLTFSQKVMAAQTAEAAWAKQRTARVAQLGRIRGRVN